MTHELEPAKIVGKNLKNLIKESGKTQEKFAEEVHADPSTVRRWICYGINKLDSIVQIAEFFGVDFRELLK